VNRREKTERTGSNRATTAYWVREAAELVLLLAVLALVGAFLALPRWLIVALPLAKALASITFYLLFLRRTLRRPIGGGAERLVGRIAQVATELRPAGRVRINGESWAARSVDLPLVHRGEPVMVIDVENGVLLVRPYETVAPDT
jgi:membrane protein implicated in regulation of membrane protease activity